MTGLWSRRAWGAAVAGVLLLASSLPGSAVADVPALPATDAGAPPATAAQRAAATSQTDSRYPHPIRRARGYVALGDSYASGQGTGIYRPGTDTATNQCHRSPLAAAPLLAAGQRRLRPLSFVACSGAVTHDLYAPNAANAGEPAQLDALRKRTKAVSLTIGGNDVGFVQLVSACVQSPVTPVGAGFGCSTNVALNGAVQARTAALAGATAAPDPAGNRITAIATVLADIHQRSPKAKIYLAGYPELFGSRRQDFTADRSAPSGYSCVLNATVGARLDYADAQWFNANTRQLNAVFRGAVRQARAAGIKATYVSTSTFDGHGLCDARTAWIQPLLLDQTGQLRPESLHPTPTGWVKGYAKAFRRAGL